MVNFKINDHVCLDKIENYFNFNLSSRLSFSDSNLNYLNRPLKSEKIINKYKLKYLNCLKVSARIFYRVISSRFNLEYSRKLKKITLKKMNFLDSRALSFANLNELDRSNLTILNKELTQSDPELYSTNLFSYMGDNENNDKQLFFLKTIYSTCKSLNLLKLFMKRKRKLKEEYSNERDNRIFDNDSLNKFENESLRNFYDNDLLINFEDNKQDNWLKNDNFKDLKQINLDHEIKKTFSIDKQNNSTDQLNNFFHLKELNDLNRKKDLKIIDQSTQTDLSIDDFKELKPIKSTSYFPPFFKINILDNFFNKISSSTFIDSANEQKCVCKNDQNKLDQSNDENIKLDINKNDLNKLDQSNDENIKLNTKHDEIDTIDLNDVNNFKFYRDPLLNQFDLDIKEQEIINYDFDEKFEKFLRHDLERLNRAKCRSNDKKIDDSSMKYDSMNCLNLFKSKIPVLKRDKTKFSRPLLDKLKIRYDPLKIRQKSKELIDVLDEDYRKKMEETKLNKKINCKLTNLKDNESIKSVKSIRSIKSIKSTLSIKSTKSINCLKQTIKENSFNHCKMNCKLNCSCDQMINNSIKSKIINVIDEKQFVSNKASNEKQFVSTKVSNLKDDNLKTKLIYLKSSRIPLMHDEESIKTNQLLLNRKQIILETKKEQKKGNKLFKLIKEIGFLKDLETLSNDKEYQSLKKCLPRTKSESFIDDQLDSERINENLRQQLLNLEFKTNGNCLFQLYDYFDNFKDKKKEQK